MADEIYVLSVSQMLVVFVAPPVSCAPNLDNLVEFANLMLNLRHASDESSLKVPFHTVSCGKVSFDHKDMSLDR